MRAGICLLLMLSFPIGGLARQSGDGLRQIITGEIDHRTANRPKTEARIVELPAHARDWYSTGTAFLASRLLRALIRSLRFATIN